MKTSNLLLLVLVLVLGASLLAIWFHPSVQDFMEGNTMWNGVRDFSDTFGAAYLDSLDNLTETAENSVLVAIPYVDYSDKELGSIRSFLDNGGTLLLMDDFGYGNTVLRYLDIPARFSNELLLDPLFRYKNQAMPRITDFGLAIKEASIKAIVFNYGTTLTNVGPAEALAWSSSMSFLDINQNDDLYAGDPRGPFVVAAEYRIGKGTVDLVADPSVLINSMVGRDNNHDFIRYLSKSDPGKLFIDRSHLSKTPLDASKIGLNHARLALSNPYVLLGIVASIFAITAKFILKRGEGLG